MYENLRSLFVQYSIWHIHIQHLICKEKKCVRDHQFNLNEKLVGKKYE